MRGNTLLAAPFDWKRLRVTGPSVPVVEGVLTNLSVGAAYFDISHTGSLVYAPGTAQPPQRSLVRVDRSGRRTVISGNRRTSAVRQKSLHGETSGVFARRQLDRVRVGRIRPERSVCATVSGARTEAADLHRWRRGTDLVPLRSRTFLSPRRSDDGSACPFGSGHRCRAAQASKLGIPRDFGRGFPQNGNYLPTIRAQLVLSRSDTSTSIGALEAPTRYELGPTRASPNWQSLCNARRHRQSQAGLSGFPQAMEGRRP